MLPRIHTCTCVMCASINVKYEKNYTNDTSTNKFRILGERALKYNLIKLSRDSDNGSSVGDDSESTTSEFLKRSQNLTSTC